MPQQDVLPEIVNRINDNTRRVRVLEERFRNIESRLINIEKLILDNQKQFIETTGQLSKDVMSLRDRMANSEVDVQNFKRDMKKLVTKTEIKELENYLSLINPILTKFVTRKEIEELLAQRIR